MNGRAFDLLRISERDCKPRTRGLTEIRGPYYTPMGKRYLADVLETMGGYVDALKFAGGSFSLMPRAAVRELIELCHARRVEVSTGGFIEHVLMQGPEIVDRYIAEARARLRHRRGLGRVRDHPAGRLRQPRRACRRGRPEGEVGSGYPVRRRRREHHRGAGGPKGCATSARRLGSPAAASTPART
jgi:(2R)-phospho-3-sulfolactate synthase (ComA)